MKNRSSRTVDCFCFFDESYESKIIQKLLFYCFLEIHVIYFGLKKLV